MNPPEHPGDGGEPLRFPPYATNEKELQQGGPFQPPPKKQRLSPCTAAAAVPPHRTPPAAATTEHKAPDSAEVIHITAEEFKNAKRARPRTDNNNESPPAKKRSFDESPEFKAELQKIRDFLEVDGVQEAADFKAALQQMNDFLMQEDDDPLPPPPQQVPYTPPQNTPELLPSPPSSSFSNSSTSSPRPQSESFQQVTVAAPQTAPFNGNTVSSGLGKRKMPFNDNFLMNSQTTPFRGYYPPTGVFQHVAAQQTAPFRGIAASSGSLYPSVRQKIPLNNNNIFMALASSQTMPFSVSSSGILTTVPFRNEFGSPSRFLAGPRGLISSSRSATVSSSSGAMISPSIDDLIQMPWSAIYDWCINNPFE